MRNFVFKWVPVIAWMMLIFAGSTDALSAEQTSRFLVPFLHWLDPHISFATIAAIHMSIRKLGHVSEYAILATLLWRAFRSLLPESLWWPAIISLGGAAGYATMDEFHQSFVPVRTASESDVMIDIFGAIAALVICITFSQAAARKRDQRAGQVA
jgi:VanZ family protein